MGFRLVLTLMTASTNAFWVNSEIADFEPILARICASAVPPREKVQLTLIEVHYALSNEPKMNIVRCP